MSNDNDNDNDPKPNPNLMIGVLFAAVLAVLFTAYAIAALLVDGAC